MKNRKLFAIITLVAFMLTMMPMMAFAATASGSSISVDDASAKVVEVKDGKVTVDSLHLVVDLDSKVKDENQFVIIFAERNGSLSDADYFKVGAEPTESYTGTWEQYISNVTQGYAVLPVEAVGEEDIYVFSKNAGTVTFKAYVITGYDTAVEELDASGIAKLYNGYSEFLKAGLVGNGCTGKFITTKTDITATGTVEAVIDDASSSIATITANETITETDATATTVPANNGVDYVNVSLRFEKGGSKLVGEDVNISVNKLGATVNKETATTSATGKVDFKVSASKAGNYVVTVECGSFTHDIEVKFANTGVVKADFSYTVNGVIATGVETAKAMVVRGYDAIGNVVTVPAGSDGLIQVIVTEAPADSSMEDQTLTIGQKGKVAFTPDVPGTYKIKVYNTNTGVAAYTTIEADEFGVVDHATISYPSANYALGATTEEPTISLVDKAGVKKDVTVTGNTKYSYAGVGVADFTNGVITFDDDDKYAGKEVTVSVVVNNKYAASTTLTIGAKPATINFTDAESQVAKEISVTGQLVDLNGNNIALSADDDFSVQSAVVIARPEGANVSVDYDAMNGNDTDAYNDFKNKGIATMKVTSSKEGVVKVNLVIEVDTKDDEDKTANYYVAGVATIAVGETTADVEEANDVVTFIIGTNTFIANDKATTSDVAPYIVDGRTFIPVRAFVEATGAAVEYDAATQVVTITGEGIDAQMTIGSNILTVNGETVVMDTAAAIKDGRTVLPVRYAGQAIGYEFECAYGANGAVTAVTMFK